MEDSEKVIVNFVNENNGKRHELEIPLNITAKALVTALNKAYNLQIDEANENECYMACEKCGFKSTLIRYEEDVTEEELLRCAHHRWKQNRKRIRYPCKEL